MELPLRIGRTFFVSSRTTPQELRDYVKVNTDLYDYLDDLEVLQDPDVNIEKDPKGAGYADITYIERYAKERAFTVDRYGQLVEVEHDKGYTYLVIYLLAGGFNEYYPWDIADLLRCDDPAVFRLMTLSVKKLFPPSANKQYREGMAEAMIQCGHTECTCIPLEKVVPRDDVANDVAVIILGNSKPSKRLTEKLIQKYKDKYCHWQEECGRIYSADSVCATTTMREKSKYFHHR